MPNVSRIYRSPKATNANATLRSTLGSIAKTKWHNHALLVGGVIQYAVHAVATWMLDTIRIVIRLQGNVTVERIITNLRKAQSAHLAIATMLDLTDPNVTRRQGSASAETELLG